eukprot:55313-Amphidinium_carterae.1
MDLTKKVNCFVRLRRLSGKQPGRIPDLVLDTLRKVPKCAFSAEIRISHVQRKIPECSWDTGGNTTPSLALSVVLNKFLVALLWELTLRCLCLVAYNEFLWLQHVET